MRVSRDADILKHIVGYCDEIESALSRFNRDYDIFKKDSVYKNAIALCVLQIGELTANLSDDFKETYTKMPWVQIKALRNIVAHCYGKIDEQILWETAINDIPMLREYCKEILSEKA